MFNNPSLKYYLPLVLLFGMIVTASAQMSPSHGGPNALKGSIMATVHDHESQKAMEYVTLSAFKTGTDDMISGAVSNHKGYLILNDLPFGSYDLEFNFMGYASKKITGVELHRKALSVDLGKITLQPDETVLNTVEVVGRESVVKYALDKKIIDVSRIATVASQTAVEILETMPSITVDIDGNVQLRGSQNFQLYIDGQPTTLAVSDALRSLPASSIKSIEIITNPSAKYEAEGTNGLINIILKKNKLQGISGLLNGSIGNYDNYNADGSIQWNSGPLSLSLGAQYRNTNRPSILRSIRQTITDQTESLIKSDGSHEMSFGVKEIHGSIGYQPSPNHQFYLNGGINNFTMLTGLDLNFEEQLNQQVFRRSTTLEKTIRDFKRTRWGLDYLYYIGGDKSHYLQARTFVSRFDGDEVATTYYILQDQTDPFGGNQNTEVGPSDLTRFNLDYSKTFEGGQKLELGSQIQYGQSQDISKSLVYDEMQGEFQAVDSLDVNATYFRDIYAFYGIYASKIGPFNYQAGLRTEKTDRKVLVNEEFTDNPVLRWDFFPSLHTSYDLADGFELMASYSRRINRPRSWYLEPFFTWRDAFNIRQGNPDLLPEYIDAYEMGFNRQLSKGSFSVELYHRTVNNLITRIKSVYNTNTFLTRPENVGKSYATGLESAWDYRVNKIWNSNLSMNIFNYRLNVDLPGVQLNDRSFSWTARWDHKFNLPNDWSLQALMTYDSPIVRAQGKKSASYGINISIRKSILDSRMSFNLQVRDVFSTTINESYESGDNFYYFTNRNPRTPLVTLAISYKFNQYKALKVKSQDSDEF